METHRTISAPEAIRRMRLISKMPGSSFVLHHFTCNLRTGEGGRMRKVPKCRLRPGLPAEKSKTDPDHYLTYDDEVTGEPRTCFKKLMRYVAFPPDYELLKIDWFID